MVSLRSVTVPVPHRSPNVAELSPELGKETVLSLWMQVPAIGHFSGLL